MTDFEQALEACLVDLEQGASNVDTCLARHPEHAAQLKPILMIVEGLERGRAIEPSAAFKSRARAKLTLHMQAHPRRSTRSGFAFWRLATNFAVIVLTFLVAGTAYAQSALPGDLFYEWKLASEHAWRVISPDPIHTDLTIANRRIDEMNAVVNDPLRSALALEAYQEVLLRLQAELDAQTLEQILPKVDVEPELIETSIPELPFEATVTPQPENTATPLPNLSTVGAPTIPTRRPPVTERPNIIPTIEIPPLLP